MVFNYSVKHSKYSVFVNDDGYFDHLKNTLNHFGQWILWTILIPTYPRKPKQQ